MKYLFVTDIEPLEPILDFNIENVNIDLHNDFDFVDIKKSNTDLSFYFKRISEHNLYAERNAVIIFSKLENDSFDSEIIVQSHHDDSLTITNFARGELTTESKYYQNKSIKYFFIELGNAGTRNIFCREAVIFLW